MGRRKKTEPVVVLPVPVEPVLRHRLDSTVLGGPDEELADRLSRTVIGQEEACREVVFAVQQWRMGLNPPGRPVSNMLFLGPTGTGKTKTVEALAEALLGNPRACIKIDCAEYQHSHEIAKLVGSPPGYLGHRETHPLLSQEILNQHHTDKMKLTLVLFDEIEKASDSLWNLLLGIMDKGTLTLGDNRKVDFSRVMVFLTSNLGTQALNDMLDSRVPGFRAPSSESPEKLKARRRETAVNVARKRFSAEFFNRLDRVVSFEPLTETHLRQILELELQAIYSRMLLAPGDHRFVFKISEAGAEFLIKTGIDKRYNARHLKRAIERLLVQPLSSLMASQQVNDNSYVEVDYEGGDELSFFKRTDMEVFFRYSEFLNSSVILPKVA